MMYVEFLQHGPAAFVKFSRDKSVLNRSHKCLLHQTYGRWHIDGRQSRERAALELPEVAANERNDAVKLVDVHLHLDSSVSERRF